MPRVNKNKQTKAVESVTMQSTNVSNENESGEIQESIKMNRLSLISKHCELLHLHKQMKKM